MQTKQENMELKLDSTVIKFIYNNDDEISQSANINFFNNVLAILLDNVYKVA